MGAMKELWGHVLDRAERLGIEGYKEQGLVLSAVGVRLAVRSYAEDLGIGAALDELPDGDPLMEQLVEAYDKGREPTRIDMQAVVRRVQSDGVEAYVEYTGGNVATIYAGGKTPWPDRNGDQRPLILAGPGWFEGSLTKPFATTAEFWIGPDDEDRPSVTVKERTDPAAIAALIVNAVRGEQARWERFGKAVEAAEGAFWAEIAKQFPEAESGDYPPDAVADLMATLNRAVALWVDLNVPGGISPDAPPVKEPRYGYVEWATFDMSAQGKWRFQLDDTVTDLHAAWTAAVDDFTDDRAAFTRAVDQRTTLNEQDLVKDYPHILARHGLTYIPEPEPSVATINVDGDDILVDGPDDADRCRVPSVGAQLCGALLEDGLCSREPVEHRRDND